MINEQCQAIILSTMDYGESDRIISLFSLEQGRIRAFAKGARASRKRFGGMLEPGNRLELTLQIKQEGLSRLERVEASRCYPGLRGNLETLALSLYGCELVEALTPEGHPLPRLYRLLSALLDHLETGSGSPTDRRFFEINLLNILGYRPPLEEISLRPLQNCLRTGTFGLVQFSDDELFFSGKLLDKIISGHIMRPLQSLAFLQDVTGERN